MKVSVEFLNGVYVVRLLLLSEKEITTAGIILLTGSIRTESEFLTSALFIYLYNKCLYTYEMARIRNCKR